MTEQDLHLIQLKAVKQLYKKQMVIFGVIILVAGVVIGIGSTTVYYAAKKVENSTITTEAPSEGPRGLEYVNEASLRQLRYRLRLSPEQDQQIRDIYTNHMAALAKIREDVRPLIAKTMNSLNDNVLAVLDDNQDAKWDEMIQRLIEMFESFDNNIGGPGWPDNGGIDLPRGGSRGGNRGGGGRRFGGGPFDPWASAGSDLVVDPNYLPRLLRRGGPRGFGGGMGGPGGFGGGMGGPSGFGGRMGGPSGFGDGMGGPSGFGGGMGGPSGFGDGMGGPSGFGGGMGEFDQDPNGFSGGFGSGRSGFRGGRDAGGFGGEAMPSGARGYGGFGGGMGNFGGGRRGMGGFGQDPNGFSGFNPMPEMEGFGRE